MDIGYIEFDSKMDAEAFCFYLGAPSREQRGSAEASVFGTLFNSTPFKGKKRFPLEIRSQSMEYNVADERIEAPLFSSGKLECKLENLEDGEGVRCHLKFVSWCPLKLNPTRALNHRLLELIDDSGLNWKKQLLRKKKDQVLHAADGNDNVISRDLDQATYRKAERAYFERTIHALIEEINLAFRTATDTPEYGEGFEEIDDPYRLPTVGLKSITLSELETYWEMEVSDASAFINSIKDTVLSYGGAARARFGSLEADEEYLIANSRSLLVRLGNGESIRIYAKLTNRVRFEVIHDPKQQSNILPQGRTVFSLEKFFELLEQLGQRSETVLNDLLAYLATWSNLPPQRLVASEQYLERWKRVFGSQGHTLSVYELLRSNGRIVGGVSLTQDQQRTLRTAKRRGLVACRNGAFYPAGE